MIASGKYLVIKANTLDARKRQRIFIEDALKNPGLRPARRIDLEGALRLALMTETAAHQAADEEEAENKKKTDDGDSGDQGSSGSGGDTRGGKSGGAGTTSSEDGDEDDMSDLELFELFLFLMDTEAKQREADLAHDDSILEPLAAATILFNRNDKVAHIDKLYTLEQENAPHAPSAYLPSLEKHIANLGAEAMHLKVHADAVPLFKKKLGYKPLGPVIHRNGKPMQRMKKILPPQTPQD
ncbi:MAG: hypothetical protein WCD70_09800 [Alphaproteobacteria bacterium]